MQKSWASFTNDFDLILDFDLQSSKVVKFLVGFGLGGGRCSVPNSEPVERRDFLPPFVSEAIPL